MSAITMQELELETAELLPARETLTTGSQGSSSYHSSNSANVGDGDGDSEQFGLLNISVLNGNFDGDGNSIAQSASS
jgi:hypothetical protein